MNATAAISAYSSIKNQTLSTEDLGYNVVSTALHKLETNLHLLYTSEKKKEAFNNLRTTNHWPAKPKLFGVNPRTYGNEIEEINPIKKPNVNQLGLKLAGF